MKLRATIFSLVTLGLFAVPVCSFAQGSIVTSPALPGAPAFSQPIVMPEFGDSPGVTLPGGGNTPVLPFDDGVSVGGDGGGSGVGVTAAPIPEPGTWGLLIGGFSGGLFALRRRKK